jgi:hypothetical protein
MFLRDRLISPIKLGTDHVERVFFISVTRGLPVALGPASMSRMRRLGRDCLRREASTVPAMPPPEVEDMTVNELTLEMGVVK